MSEIHSYVWQGITTDEAVPALCMSYHSRCKLGSDTCGTDLPNRWSSRTRLMLIFDGCTWIPRLVQEEKGLVRLFDSSPRRTWGHPCLLLDMVSQQQSVAYPSSMTSIERSRDSRLDRRKLTFRFCGSVNFHECWFSPRNNLSNWSIDRFRTRQFREDGENKNNSRGAWPWGSPPSLIVSSDKFFESIWNSDSEAQAATANSLWSKSCRVPISGRTITMDYTFQ